MNLAQLVYISSRTPELDSNALAAIAEHSSHTNRVRDISGVLLCHGQTIMQLLEGDHTAVESLFDRICLDPRHTNPQMVLFKNVKRRLFPEWGMGLADLSKKSVVSADRLRRLIDDVRDQHHAGNSTLEARILLNDFRQQIAAAI